MAARRPSALPPAYQDKTSREVAGSSVRHRQFRQFALLAVTLAAATANAATAPPAKTAAEWLRQMDDAFRALDYDGVFSYYTAERPQQAAQAAAPPSAGRELALRFGTGYRSAARLATYRVVHKVVDGVERERIEHLDGPRREVLRIGDRIVCALQPGDELLALDGALPATPNVGVFARRFDRMGDSYRVQLRGHDRIAGRNAVRLAITPHDQDRFGYQLWLDEDTGLLLRSELRDVEAAELEIFQFASVRIGDGVDAADLAPATPNAILHDLAQPAAPPPAAAQPSPWRAGWVPRGFHMASAGRQAPAGAAGLGTMVFSDGLAAFSVFIEAMPQDGANNVVSRRGATVVLTHAKPGGATAHLVTVVGEVPVTTARRVAASVYRQSP